MARYIDADLMIADIQRYLCATCSIHCPSTRTKNSACEIAECLRMIDNAPTADADSVKHGRWIETNDDTMKRCTECDVIHLIAQYPHGNANYCPNCGAKMDESEVCEDEID